MQKQRSGFTIIEILVVVSIIAILVSVVLAMIISAKNKAAMNGYRSSMQSVRTAIEACTVGSTFQTGVFNIGDSICIGSSEKFPSLGSKCNASAPTFSITGSVNSWSVTTPSWDCKGCRFICDVYGCNEAAPGTCK